MHFIRRAMACLLVLVTCPALVADRRTVHRVVHASRLMSVVPLVPQSPYRFSLAQFQHRSYLSTGDGAPANAQTIVQTPDGFLWIGSQNGLIRFDGVHFDRSPTDLLPKTNVSSLVSRA